MGVGWVDRWAGGRAGGWVCVCVRARACIPDAPCASVMHVSDALSVYGNFTLYPIRTLSIPYPNFMAIHGVGVAQAKPACKHTIATRKCYQYNTIQYNTIQYNTIQYNTIQYNTMNLNTCLHDVAYTRP